MGSTAELLSLRSDDDWSEAAVEAARNINASASNFGLNGTEVSPTILSEVAVFGEM